MRTQRIFWPNVISNEDLYARTSCTPLTDVICRIIWRWIGHILSMSNTITAKEALYWIPDGKRKRGKPKEAMRRAVVREMKERGWSSNYLEIKAKDRTQWRSMVETLYTLCDED